MNGAWYIYYAAAEREFEPSGMPTHRMYVIENTDADPTTDNWVEKGQVVTQFDTFSLDATTEVIDGVQYLVWAQKDPDIPGNSNLYIARMKNPWTLDSEPVMLTKPEYDWECIDFLVNEGPAFLFPRRQDLHHVLGVRYRRAVCRGPADRRPWCRSARLRTAGTKSPVPVFKTCAENGQYGPGHNSFTKSEDGAEDLMIYHCRNYTEIKGDPLFDSEPSRPASAWCAGPRTAPTSVYPPPMMCGRRPRPRCCLRTAVRSPAPPYSDPNRFSRLFPSSNTVGPTSVQGVGPTTVHRTMPYHRFENNALSSF